MSPSSRLLSAVLPLLLLLSPYTSANCNSLLDYDARLLRSERSINLCESYQGKVVVMVNTASQCGYTPQFKELEQLYQRYKDQGLVLLGFPSNDFKQEHDDEAKTAEVCYVNYGVSFTMLATSKVTGANANTVFKQLTEQTGSAPSWNFNKYIVGRDGRALQAFKAKELPLGGDLEAAVQAALAQ